MKLLFSLRFILPFIISIIISISMLVSYGSGRTTALATAVKRVSAELRNDLTLLQGVIAQIVARGNETSIKQIVAGMASKPDLLAFIVVNNDGLIIASNDYSQLGIDWRVANIRPDIDYINKVIDNHTIDVKTDKANEFLEGYSSICIDSLQGRLRQNECGFIFYRVSLEYHYRDSIASLRYATVREGIAVLAGALLLMIAIDFLVSRRVKKINTTLTRFAAGERGARLSCWGRDELRWLGDNINVLLDGVIRDEIILRERQHRLDTLFEIIIDAIVVIDERGVVQRANSATTRMFGYTEQELLGNNVSLIMPEPDSVRHNGYLNNYLSSGEKKIIGKGREVLAKSKEGTTFYVDLSISEMNLDGERTFVGVMRDVTERRRMEYSLVEANKALAEANHLLEVTAMTDGLTGLANRRHFDLALHEAVNRATRDNGSLALLICDVDYFKNYNDYYGHQAGDECLKKLAEIIMSLFQRAGEVSARYGGEEFAVILPDCERRLADDLASRMLLAVRSLRLDHPDSQVADIVTLSIGYSVYIPSSKNPPSIEELIKNADEGLYNAKRAGRNQVVYGGDTISL